MATSRVIGLDIGSSSRARCRARVRQRRTERQERRRPSSASARSPLPLGAVRDGEVRAAGDRLAARCASSGRRPSSSPRTSSSASATSASSCASSTCRGCRSRSSRSRCRSRSASCCPMSTDDALLDFFPTGEVDGPQGRMVHGMLVAAQRDTVDAERDRGRGRRAAAPDGRPQRVRAASVRSPAASWRSATAAFVDIGASHHHGRRSPPRARPAWCVRCPSGGQNVTNAVATALEDPGHRGRGRSSARSASATPSRPERAEAAEAITHRRDARSSSRSATRSSTTRAATRAQGIDVVVLTGGGSHLPGLGQYLSSASRLPVTLGDPLAGLRIGQDRPARVAERPRVAHRPPRRTRLRSCRMTTLAGAARARDRSGSAGPDRRPAPGQPPAARGPGRPRRCGTSSSGSSSVLARRPGGRRRRVRPRAARRGRGRRRARRRPGRDGPAAGPRRRSTPRCRRCSARSSAPQTARTLGMAHRGPCGSRTSTRSPRCCPQNVSIDVLRGAPGDASCAGAARRAGPADRAGRRPTVQFTARAKTAARQRRVDRRAQLDPRLLRRVARRSDTLGEDDGERRTTTVTVDGPGRPTRARQPVPRRRTDGRS